MARRMLIDATHPEETRVVILNGNRLEEFDFESSTKKQIKGDIYLAKVTKVEPSLQAAFVEYGGNRHGFLAFSEIHPDYYQIPVSDREAMRAAERAAEALHDDEAEPHEIDHDEAIEQPDHHDHDEEAPDHDDAASGDADGEPPHPVGPAGGADAHEAAAAPAEPDDRSGEPTVAERAVPAEAGAGIPTLSEPEPASDEASDAPPHDPENGAGETVSHIDEVAEAPVAPETVGGDELEEVRSRPRVRHYRNYKIQEVIKRRQILLVQVSKEERGTKGAALTTYMSLAGRYCVLMPNAGRGGGVSRKITSAADRRRLKDLMDELEVPDGMGVIVRTAGSERSKPEIKRDYEYLMRLWDDIRSLTLKSSAPAQIYEEGSLIKRAVRDLYTRDIEEILVEGEAGYRQAKELMRMLTPSHAGRVKHYRDPAVPLFHRYQVDAQIDQIHNPVVQLRSGGYIVINPTEALVSIDVNSGRATRERNIEETATKTNLEAAEEIARQLRLRDLAGLVVIDFIDMEENRNQRAVEARLKDAMKSDRARIQVGRISAFGLLELSRQRLRSSLIEASGQLCPHCNGTGTIRSTESTALTVLRGLEEEGIKRRTAEITVHVPTAIALYLLNQKRQTLVAIEQRYGFAVTVAEDDHLIPPAFRLDRMRPFSPAELAALPVPVAPVWTDDEEEDEPESELGEDQAEADGAAGADAGGEDGQGRRKRRRRRRRRGDGAAHHEAYDAQGEPQPEPGDEADGEGDEATEEPVAEGGDPERPALAAHAGPPEHGERRRRRRGRRGGRQRRGEDGLPQRSHEPHHDAPAADAPTAFGPEEFEPYPASPFDYARDGRAHLFDEDPDETPPVAPPAAVAEPAPQTAEPEATAPEPIPEPEPAKRKRAPRRKADATPDAAPEAATGDAPADEPAPKPARKPRTRKTAPAPDEVPAVASEATAAIEPEPVTPEPTPAAREPEPVAAEPAVEDDRPRRTGWWRR